jgi:hypothetical protein
MVLDNIHELMDIYIFLYNKDSIVLCNGVIGIYISFFKKGQIIFENHGYIQIPNVNNIMSL